MSRACSIVGLGFMLLLAGCQPSVQLHRFGGFAQGTMYHVSYVAPAGHDTARLQRAVEAELQAIDRLFSNWRDDSVVERFNADPSIAPIEVGPELVGLIEKARRVHAASRGCFDPTIGPLTALWRRAADQGALPKAVELAESRQQIGLDRLVTVDSNHLKKRRSDLRLDLSGIAQGASLARLARIFDTVGIDAYSIEIGGELVVRGAKPGGRPWRIAVLDPDPRARTFPEAIEYAGERARTIATSGTYLREVEIDGQRYSHIIDPRTGRPVTHETVSVTVVHVDPALADAWSTALLCLGSDDGRAVAAEHDLAALFIQRDGRFETTPTWPDGG